MKKTTIASIATAGVSLILFIVSAIFIVWDREKPDATSSILITSILTLACALIATIVFAILFDKKHKMLMLIPMIALFAGTITFTKGINDTFGNGGASIIDFISPAVDNPTILAFLLLVIFVVAMVLVLWKNYKWASIAVISYISILLITTFNNVSSAFFVEKNLLFILSSTGLLVALAAIIVYFISPFVSNNDIVIKKKEKPAKEEKVETPKPEKVKKEKVKKEKKSKKDEQPVVTEETPVAENNEAPVENKEITEDTEAPAEEVKEEVKEEASEEKIENTESENNEAEEKVEENNDPFKNQYSSSSSIFDVQDDAEKNQE